jgi:hypothetical protein
MRLPRTDKSGLAMTPPFVFARLTKSAEAISFSLMSLRGAEAPKQSRGINEIAAHPSGARNDTSLCLCEADEVNRSNLVVSMGLPRTLQVLAMTPPFVFARGGSPEAISVDECWGLPRPDKSGLAMTKYREELAMTPPFVFARHDSAEAIAPPSCLCEGESTEAISLDGCWGLPRPDKSGLAMTE